MIERAGRLKQPPSRRHGARAEKLKSHSDAAQRREVRRYLLFVLRHFHRLDCSPCRLAHAAAAAGVRSMIYSESWGRASAVEKIETGDRYKMKSLQKIRIYIAATIILSATAAPSLVAADDRQDAIDRCEDTYNTCKTTCAGAGLFGVLATGGKGNVSGALEQCNADCDTDKGRCIAAIDDTRSVGERAVEATVEGLNRGLRQAPAANQPPAPAPAPAQAPAPAPAYPVGPGRSPAQTAEMERRQQGTHPNTTTGSTAGANQQGAANNPTSNSTSASSQARYAGCIKVAKREQVATYLTNTCNQTLHLDFRITGGTDYRGKKCDVGYRGAYTFGPNYGPVNLLLTGCSAEYWVCDMQAWNRNGGRCY